MIPAGAAFRTFGGGGLRAALAAAWLSFATFLPHEGQAQGSGATQSAALAGQKMHVLEAYLGSERVAQAAIGDPERAVPLIEEARAKLVTGRAALEKGQVSQAIAQFDDGMRAVSSAVAGAAAPARKQSPGAYQTRRAQVVSYLDALDRSEVATPEETARAAELRTALEAADELAEAGKQKAAGVAIGAVYAEVVRYVSELRRGHTVLVRRVFETAEEEYDYERERNHSYRMLVEIAIAERGAEQPGLAAMAASLGEASAKLRGEAETLAAVGEHATAIRLMERATERLSMVLRASGVLVAE